MSMLLAKFKPRSGFSDYQLREYDVRILGFTEATIEPRDRSGGSKRCVVAVVADAHGRLSIEELCDLTLKEVEEG